MSALDIFLMLTALLGGLALFLFGMSFMSDSLTNITGNGLRNMIEKVTKKKVSGYLFGTGITAVVQSSSTTTVMVVGFVNAGIMTLFQAVNVILGANLGTTATAWLLSLNSFDGDSLLMAILKPANFAPFLAVAAVFITMFNKKESVKTICNIIIGFSMLMIGMSMMSSAMGPLGENESFRSLLTAFENPLLSYGIAVVFTMIVQSCDATVGIIQALAMTTGVSYAVCVPMICGAQLGTCITSIISSVGGSRNGRRASFLHLFYNIIKTVSFMAILYTINAFVDIPFLAMSASLVGIAAVHSLINVAYSAIILPMSGLLVKLVNIVVPLTEDEKDIDKVVSTLNPILLKTAPIALTQAKVVADMIAKMVLEICKDIQESFHARESRWESVSKNCDKILLYYDKLDEYTLQIKNESLSKAENKKLIMIRETAVSFATIVNTYQAIHKSLEIAKEKEAFELPTESKRDLIALYTALDDVLVIVAHGFTDDNPTFVKSIPAFRKVIYDMQITIIKKAMRHHQEGEYTYNQQAFVSELSHCFERVLDCCDHISQATLNAHLAKKNEPVDATVDEEQQMRIARELFKDKYDYIMNSGFIDNDDNDNKSKAGDGQ